MESLDVQTVEQTYLRYWPIIRSKCSRMLGDATEAQDVAQETFARLWDHRDSIRDPKAVTAWVYRTSTRLAFERFRRSRRMGPISDTHGQAAGSSHGGNPEEHLHWQHLLHTLGRSIPAKEFEVAILCHLDGLSQAEIGEVMGKSERTVRRLMARFEARLERLRGRLQS